MVEDAGGEGFKFGGFDGGVLRVFDVGAAGAVGAIPAVVAVVTTPDGTSADFASELFEASVATLAGDFFFEVFDGTWFTAKGSVGGARHDVSANFVEKLVVGAGVGKLGFGGVSTEWAEPVAFLIEELPFRFAGEALFDVAGAGFFVGAFAESFEGVGAEDLLFVESDALEEVTGGGGEEGMFFGGEAVAGGV